MPKSRFFSVVDKFNGSFTQLEENSRRWEQIYRRRWAHDKVVRTTHGVNCTGSCSWNVYVKEGLITWEHQATDYPACAPNMPDYEPRGCPRGASFSWYEYSPLRIKYPYVRGRLWTLWIEAKKQHENLVEAWGSIVEDPEKAKSYKSARGHGGLVRVQWEDALELVSAMLTYTIKKYGPDRLAGFSPIPAMSMISYASGARFLSLIGGELLSFYDWYADLPPASPQIWGEQTDVPEAADWYNSQYLIMWGSNVPLTRTPDAHFMTEARYKGTKVVAVSPDYAENVKFADNWLAPKPGTDSALAQGMTYQILKEFYVDKQTPRFVRYAKQFTDLPFLVILDENGEHLKAGRFLRISDLREGEVNADWKPVLIDANDNKIKVPNGTIGQRWDHEEKWNLRLDGIDPALSVASMGSMTLTEIDFPYFDEDGASAMTRQIPYKEIILKNGKKARVATVYDLMLAQFGLIGETKFDVYTPSWAEKITGVKASLIQQIGREFALTSLETGGKAMVIMGAGINQWYNSDMTYRAIINMCLLCGTEGISGGGWAHYVGQEKLRPKEGWAAITFANDWNKGAMRQQNGTSFFYFAADQWKYDELDNEALKSPISKISNSKKHPADYNQMAVRLGWLPSYPQFNRNNLDFVKDYGTTDQAEVVNKVVNELKAGTLKFAVEDPDAPINQPKGLFVWRSNLFSSSAKGQEYFMKHLLGAENNLLSKTNDKFKPEEMTWSDEETTGKLDLVIDVDFRMVATPMYSDVILPAATWYEKEDLSSTDMHPFIHPFNQAVAPLWESKSDWQTFRALAKRFTELAQSEFPEPVYDLHASPLAHDTVSEIAQPFGKVLDWKKGEIEAVPGKTLPNLKLVKREYSKLYEQYITLGPNLQGGTAASDGLVYSIANQYEELKDMLGTRDGLPDIYDEKQVADAILTLSSTSNGKVAMNAWKALEEESGQHFQDIGAGYVHTKMTFKNITAQPIKSLPTPAFTSIRSSEETYSPFTIQIERLVPFRTLTGRQQFFIDHEIFDEFGEQLTTYKPGLPPHVFGPEDSEIKSTTGKELTLRYMTPHGKWNIHTMYGDNLEMLTLFRGGPTVWISNVDAAKADIKDNDWLEVYNRNGIQVARAVVSHRMPEGTLYSYHGQDMHVNEPHSNITGNRGGSHNAPTRVQVKPTQMVGGYAQLSYGFNYYGPIGCQRDLYCNVRKLEKTEWTEE